MIKFGQLDTTKENNLLIDDIGKKIKIYQKHDGQKMESGIILDCKFFYSRYTPTIQYKIKSLFTNDIEIITIGCYGKYDYINYIIKIKNNK